MKNLRYKYYNKRIPTRDDGNVWSHDPEESKLRRIINMNSGSHTLSDVKIIESPFNKNSIVINQNK